MLTRKIDAAIDAIYDNSKMALMLTGARQVGKTNAFRRLAQRKFKHYVEINFIEIGDGTVLPIEVKSGKDYAYEVFLITK